ncbi:MAG: helix-turn-helix transcriptional regulator [Burkholderiales bacterium]|nr:helix-turn-helix transcriptional regulator [Burkholderiales bacterium]
MSKIQFIEFDGERRFAVVPIELWERLGAQEALEDAEDLAALAQFRRTDTGARVPHSVVKRIAEGKHPIAAWRAERKLSAAELARRAGVTRQMMSLIESGKRIGTAGVLRKIANALEVPLDALLQSA